MIIHSASEEIIYLNMQMNFNKYKMNIPPAYALGF